jgi:hypothetical protein
MPRLLTTIALAALAASTAIPMAAWSADAPYKVLKTVKAGGDGSWDYVYADAAGRKLYAPRLGQTGHVMVFDLDTLAAVGDMADINGHGVAVDPKSGHGFVSSKPVAMFDAKTLAPIKTIEVQGSPDGILGDPSSGRIYILSHSRWHPRRSLQREDLHPQPLPAQRDGHRRQGRQGRRHGGCRRRDRTDGVRRQGPPVRRHRE